MKVKKFIVSLLLLVSCTLFFAGCSNNYNADLTCKFYNELDEWCKSEFLETNRIGGATYLVEDENGEIISSYVEDAPSSRSILVNTDEVYNQIFIGRPISVNFDEQMLIICTCAVINNRDIKISDIKLSQNSLSIKFKAVKSTSNIADTSAPTQKYLFVVMDKLAINTISFELDD